VREIEEKFKVRQIITLLLQFDTHILMAKTMTREKNNKKPTNKSYFNNIAV
jgi:hypothetical protein